MDVVVSSVVAVQIALTEREAEEFIADASAVQKRVYELLFPVNAKSTQALPKSKCAPKMAARKSGKQTGRSSGTLTCPSDRAFKYRMQALWPTD
jgi:hypothetical protein